MPKSSLFLLSFRPVLPLLAVLLLPCVSVILVVQLPQVELLLVTRYYRVFNATLSLVARISVYMLPPAIGKLKSWGGFSYQLCFDYMSP